MSRDESRGNGVLPNGYQQQQQQQQQHLKSSQLPTTTISGETGVPGRGSAGPPQYPSGAEVKPEMRGKVEYSKLPWGVWLLEKLNLCCFHPTLL